VRRLGRGKILKKGETIVNTGFAREILNLSTGYAQSNT